MLSKEVSWTLWGFFLAHAALFVCVNLFFMLLNLALREGGIWFVTPLFFWLLLLLFHYALNKLIISGFFINLQHKILDRLEK